MIRGKKWLLKPLIIISLSLCVMGLMWVKYQADIKILKTTYQQERKVELETISKNVEEKLQYVYQTIRTMSFVPGVRKIDRHAEQFDKDARATIQQLYNNAYLNIKLSEIYLLPQTLDPDKIDEITKKNEEPIMTFDEFIASGFAEEKNEKEATTAQTPPKLEEVEIFEYRLMKNQLEYLGQHFSTNNSFQDLNVPMVSGPEVVTCDNAEFNEE